MALLKDLIVQGVSRFVGDVYLPGTKGSFPYQSGLNTTSMLPIGTSGQVLKVGSGGVPVWSSDSNDDTKVTQTVTTSSNTSWRPLIVGYSYNDSTTFSPSTVTDTVLASHLAKFAPSTGILAVVGLNKMNANGTVTTGSNDVVFNTNGTTTTLGSNAYTSTAYLPLSGGTMTGPLKWNGDAALPEKTSPQYFLNIDAFASGGQTYWSSKANTLQALTGLTSSAVGNNHTPIYWTGSAFAVTKDFNNYLLLSGGTMTGALTTPSLTVTGASSFSQAINGSILGNAATASRWQNARTLTLTGAVTGSVSIDGSANVSMATTVNHNHDDRYYTETESDGRYLKLAGGWMNTDAQIAFKGYNSSTSTYAEIGYLASVGGNRYHLGGDTYNTKGLYIYTNGYNASNDYGGLAIDNDGVTAFGAGDTGSVFRVINEDNVSQGAQFAVEKENGAYVRNNLTVGAQSVDTNSKLAVIGNVRITNSTSNTGCKMEYNATEECLEFNF